MLSRFKNSGSRDSVMHGKIFFRTLTSHTSDLTGTLTDALTDAFH